MAHRIQNREQARALNLPAQQLIVIASIAILMFAGWARADALPILSARGEKMVDASGKQITLKGCNLGNWLMLESWMLGGCISDNGKPYHDQAQLFRVMRERFGENKFRHLVELYRDGYITPRDFDLVKSFGFNLVRLPFDYRMIQEDAPPYRIRPDGFVWLDHALDLAEAADVYVILDLHGVPGGQSMQDHTGESGQDHLWGSDSNKQRTVEIWRALAEHYKDRSVVAAYDLINEPYADHKLDVRGQLAELCPKIYAAIRSTGDQHVMFFPGALGGGVSFYGDPHAAGMENVGFTEHFYPGLFGKKPVIEGHAQMLNQTMAKNQAYIQHLQVPYFVGEFNVVLQSNAANAAMRAYYDRFAEDGWLCTMWSYKLLTPGGGVHADAWYLVTNENPLSKIELSSGSYEDFEKFFTSFAEMPLAVNEPMRQSLTSSAPPPLYLTNYPALSSAPAAGVVHQTNMLTNGSFETAGKSGDVAASWSRWGSWMNREAGWTPTHSGKALMGYHHWQIETGETSGIWQDVDAEPGKRYTFSIYAQRDAKGAGNEAGAVELRMENVLPDGKLELNWQSIDAAKLATGNDWTHLSVSGTSQTGKMRVLVMVTPSAKAPRGGAVKLDDADLVPASDGH